jgi:hypothetical protein
MIYLPLTALPPEAISSALWAISRPDAESKGTRLYCGWITHPETGQHALTLNPDDTQPIHPESDLAIAQLVGGLTPFATAQEIDQLTESLTNAKGGRINVVDMLPASLSANLLDQQTAEADGWFETEITQGEI